jgi:hypothetical protein
MFLLEPTLLASLDWPSLLLLTASTGGTGIAICLLGAILAFMPGGETLMSSRERGKALRGSLTMAFSMAFVVECVSLAITTRSGGTFGSFVRVSLQYSVVAMFLSWALGFIMERTQAPKLEKLNEGEGTDRETRKARAKP